MEAIFRKHIHNSPARLHSMQFEILPYNTTIRYEKGSELCIADTLSRECHNIPEQDARAVYGVWVVIPMSAHRIAQLKDAINTSAELSALCRFILQGWPDTIQQLAVYEDIIFKGKRTLLPPSWKPLILSQLHCSHKGVQGTLAIARYHVFWPDRTKNIIFVQKCATCQKIQNDSPQEYLSVETVPLRPWMYVASDLFHYKDKNFLLVVDSYSDYFNLHVLTSSTSNEVIKTLKVWFT
ncbi:hypothetical protein PR048_020048 [Dryococelus australis]|uniref:RNA-directed DNA polymerase n=1 Tax=Dryococelus australis TaxID=614101 RepID=A0ABQ9H580_9NEOP|nr:hypothetical protein PR048_020048 [Dryococelus australis]